MEYSESLCKIARKNLQKLGIQGQIICQDATDYQFPQKDLFVYFYHPFSAAVLRKVLGNLPSGNRVVVGYQGEGREDVGEQTWLRPFAHHADATVYRNF